MSEDKKPGTLLDSVLAAGAALIVLRHTAKSPEDAAKVKQEHNAECFMKCFDDALAKVDAAIDELTDPNGHGIKVMRFGKGLRFLDTARECGGQGFMRGAYVSTLEAHDAFETVLSAHGVKTPTNKEIASAIGLLNRR